MNSKIIAFTIEAHQNVNHLYHNKPYVIHLAIPDFYLKDLMSIVFKSDINIFSEEYISNNKVINGLN